MATIVILTSETEFPYLAGMLLAHDHKAEIVHAGTLAELTQVATATMAPARLIGFCTNVIVPSEILQAFKGGCYNFHPAPPSYPGYRPASFAIYQKAQHFGATAHRMVEIVDAGEIVGAAEFPIQPGWSYLDLSIAAYSATAGLFNALTSALVNMNEPLPGTGHQWGAYTYKKSDYDRMLKIPPRPSS